MAIKEFLLEVEEGETPNCRSCFIGVNSALCDKYAQILNCMKYNLATMKIKELEENNESKS